MDRQIARLYLRRTRNRQLALANARGYRDHVLLVHPARRLKLQCLANIERAHRAGQHAAVGIHDFLRQAEAADALGRTAR